MGNGHRPEIPTEFPALVQTPLPPALLKAQLAGQLEATCFAYRMGEISILVSKELGLGWHMSVAHPSRYPTWDEMVHIRYTLLPDEVTMAMFLPPQSEYINIHNNCFQLYQVRP
ncbi:MAG: hypothetical protein WC196_07110 [Bacilli bacterium]|jgi:hypothetical protein